MFPRKDWSAFMVRTSPFTLPHSFLVNAVLVSLLGISLAVRLRDFPFGRRGAIPGRPVEWARR